MEFFGMGPLEIVIILIVGLIAVGPGKLPQLARNLAKGISAFRKATMDLTTEVSKEFESLEKEEKEPVKQKKKVQATDKPETTEEDEASNRTR
ncbi:MAG: twin-arginine translocase TatA/TatE family subunit [Dehalococcoidia bacterium]|nr:twin-arginine translocase TatA/TatE family subunit [Dehalococcoidia bacterium]